jgi:hypothetical protein
MIGYNTVPELPPSRCHSHGLVLYKPYLPNPDLDSESRHLTVVFRLVLDIAYPKDKVPKPLLDEYYEMSIHMGHIFTLDSVKVGDYELPNLESRILTVLRSFATSE